MSLNEIEAALSRELEALAAEGRAKACERVINGYIPAQNGCGPRYRLQGSDTTFLRMNSNSYLSLAHHPKLIEAADRATHEFGVGPGAVRFIDGTYSYHRELEKRIAEFTGKPAAKIFNSAYTANCGLALTISSRKTQWIGDQINHNSIIRAMRIAGVARNNKGIFKHNDMDDLRRCFEEIDASIDRVIVICDGVYSMRGDTAPLKSIEEIAGSHAGR
ncbi:MAG TPA: aminotransferase class I/II-fold pyridoxal phosphate-dependent enzyme, partial [Desulfopila sp.]|nr:aminotransferase class I/II-fold pyridoxal phosphate-dependent enzyme [Desulfopila sp.]